MLKVIAFAAANPVIAIRTLSRAFGATEDGLREGLDSSCKTTWISGSPLNGAPE
jgi:hypothetical protein